jgi:hypothetical protein
MGLLSSAMKTELRTNRQVYWLLDLALAGGTVRMASGNVSSTSLGQYYGKVQKWGTFRRSARDRSYSLSASEMSPIVIDTDRTLVKAARGANGGTFRGSSATVRLASPNVSVTNWLTFFSGVVADYDNNQPDELMMQLNLRSNDLVLRRFLRVTINQADWPFAPASARGKLAPRIYGVHDSAGDGGAIPCPLVDINRNYYLVALGWIKSVDRVYVDKVQAAGGWSKLYVTVNGRRWTVISFTTSQGSKTITADVQGLTTTADGTGTLFQVPSNQLKHFLVNWVYNDYRAQGAWFDDSTAPVDTTWFTAAQDFTGGRGIAGSRYIGGGTGTRGIDVVNEWSGSLKCQPFWTGLGKLAVRYPDHGISTIYLDEPWIQWNRARGRLPVKWDSVDLIDSVTVNYQRNEVMNKYTQTLTVRDPAATPLSLGSDAIDLAWSKAA